MITLKVLFKIDLVNIMDAGVSRTVSDHNVNTGIFKHAK